MATRIEAVQAYRPRIIPGTTVQKRELVKLLSSRTGINESEAYAVLTELRDALIFYALSGRAVRLDGLGTYRPSMKVNGKINLSHRIDENIRSAINVSRDFRGEVRFKENIGKTSAELIALWNEDHPDDPVEL